MYRISRRFPDGRDGRSGRYHGNIIIMRAHHAHALGHRLDLTSATSGRTLTMTAGVLEYTDAMRAPLNAHTDKCVRR